MSSVELLAIPFCVCNGGGQNTGDATVDALGYGLTRQYSECRYPDFMSEVSSFEPERFKCSNDDASFIGCPALGVSRDAASNSHSRGRIQILWRNISHSNTTSCRPWWMAVAARCLGSTFERGVYAGEWRQ